MVALRSRRLENVLGGPLDDLKYNNIERLVAGRVPEEFDLDFKRGLYGNSNAEKNDLATDVAALSNTAGGLLILGIDEDSLGQAVAAPGVQLSDDEVNRMLQVVGSRVVPLPSFQIIPVSKPPQDDHGFYVIAVLRDPLFPHAVIVNDGLRYPRRNGRTVGYLSEPEVAAAYRERLAGADRQAARIQDIEHEAMERLDTVTGNRWVVVSLVPDLAGDLVIDAATFTLFRREVLNQFATIAAASALARFHRASVGRRRLLADGTKSNSTDAEWLSLELHDDGSGVCCIAVVDRSQHGPGITDPGRPAPFSFHAEDVAIDIASGLWQLGRHSRDRAAAGGSALVRAQIYPVSLDQQAVLVNSSQRGFNDRLGDRTLFRPQRPAEAVAELDGLAQPGTALIEASALLLNEIGQSFGVAEMGQFSRTGQVRRRYWSLYRSQIEAWAGQHPIEVTDDTFGPTG